MHDRHCSAQAKNLIAAGYKVVVWNRSAEKCASLQEAGAKVVATPAAVAQAADYTFAMLSDDAAARAVLEGPEGICAGISGKGYVDASTLSTAAAIENGELVRQAGGLFVEAPVSGSKAPAEQGQLIFLAAGDRELYNAVAAPLEVMGKAKFFLGSEVGAGTRMKLVANMMMGTMMATLAEGIHLAEKSDLSAEVLLEVVSLGAMANPMFALKVPPPPCPLASRCSQASSNKHLGIDVEQRAWVCRAQR